MPLTDMGGEDDLILLEWGSCLTPGKVLGRRKNPRSDGQVKHWELYSEFRHEL